MNDEIVFMPYSFLNGDKGAHVSISGKSGVATKTSYALFLLYMLFETDWGLRARGGSSHDRALVFSVKGSDLCLLDKANNRFVDTDDVGVAGHAAVDGARRPRPGPVPGRRRVRPGRGRRRRTPTRSPTSPCATSPTPTPTAGRRAR